MINRQTFIDYNLDISIAIKDESIERWVTEAKQFDIRKGFDNDEFYFLFLKEIQKKPIPEAFNNIYNEHEYTYNDYIYKHLGVKLAIVYFAYARYIEQGNLASTPHGLIIKNQQESQQGEPNIILKTINKYKKQAFNVFDDIKLFLLRDPNNQYDTYYTKINSEAQKDIRFQIGVINSNTKTQKSNLTPNQQDEVNRLKKFYI